MFYFRQLKEPIAVVWEITNNCNYRCPHCRAYMDVTKDDEVVEERVIQQLISNEVMSVNISGGEPLLNPRILNIIKAFSDENIDVGISSNGWLYPKMAEKLKKAGQTFLQVSVDGPKEIHDAFRGVNGAFENAMKSLVIAKELGIRTQMNVTITSKNISTLDYNLELAQKLGIDRIFYRRVVPAGKGKENIYILPNKEEYLRVIKRLSSIKSDVIDIAIDDPIVSVIQNPEGADNNAISCTAGIKSLGIDSNANVYPCIFLREKVGNLMDDSLQEIWTKSEILSNLRKHDIGACGKCKYNFVCGGCRAYSGLYEKDAMCPKDFMESLL